MNRSKALRIAFLLLIASPGLHSQAQSPEAEEAAVLRLLGSRQELLGLWTADGASAGSGSGYSWTLDQGGLNLYRYDQAGRLSRHDAYDRQGSQLSRRDYRYQDGRLFELESHDYQGGQRRLDGYDPQGRLSLSRWYAAAGPSDGEATEERSYRYDDAGRLELELRRVSGRPELRIEYGYASGRVGPTTERWLEGAVLIKSIEYDSKDDYTTDYYAAGELIARDLYSGGRLVRQQFWQGGRLLRERIVE